MNYKLLLGLWLCPVVTVLAAPGVETSFQPVALSAQLAPGLTNNIKFSFFEYVSLADDGWIAFTAKVSGPGVTSTNNQGLWAGLPGDISLALRTGHSVLGDSNQAPFRYLSHPNLDNHHAMAFAGITSPTNSKPDTAGQESIRDRLELLFMEWHYFNLGHGWRTVFVTQAVTPPLGHVVNCAAYRAEVAGPGVSFTNNQLLVAGPPTNLMTVARTGFPAPGVSGNFAFFPHESQAMALTPDGNVAFKAQASDGGATLNGLWFGKAGTVQVVALQNRPAPASLLGPGYTFGFVPVVANVQVNARGELAFATYLAGPGLNNTNGAFVVAGPPGGLRVIAQSGQPAPGIPGAVFADFSHVLLGTDGTVAFTARYTTNGTDLIPGLWLTPSNGAPPILLMHAGQRAPGTPADVYFKSSFADEAYFMNSRNQVVFRFLLTGPGLDFFDKGVWLAEPNGTVSLIVRKGDMVDTGNGVMAKVSNVSFGADPEFTAGPEDGRRTPFNNRGEVALQIYFDAPPFPLTGDGGIFIAQTGIILCAERTGNDIRVKFPTLTNHNYRVEYKTNLVAGAWSVLAPSVAGTGGEVVVTNTGVATSGRRYYQVVRTD